VQRFFRDTVLGSYNSRCAICELGIPSLLAAGHIIPWSVDVRRRADPTNGLCLCALHDRAFDRGILGLDEGFRVMVSREVLTMEDEQTEEHKKLRRIAFVEVKGKPIVMPGRFRPDAVAVEWHRENVFRG
jgi:predicted restriction endonuclease